MITIPFGIQSFKFAGYALWPFHRVVRVVVYRPNRDVALGCLGNVLWFVFGGFATALLASPPSAFVASGVSAVKSRSSC